MVEEPELSRLIAEKNWDRAVQRVLSHPKEAKYRYNGKNGHSVLFTAIRQDATLEVVRALLHAYPAAQYDCFDARSDVRTAEGWTVVHEAALFSPYPAVVKLLVERNPSFTRMVDVYGRNPLRVLSLYCFNRVGEGFSEEKAIVFEKVCVLVEAMVHGSLRRGREFRLLHDLIRCAKHMDDVNLIQYAVNKFPDKLQEVEENGNTPLHIACAVEGARNEGFGDCTRSTIDILVSAYPEAARMKNRNNVLPLHLAIKNGKDRLVSLIDAYPPAVLDVDNETGLYPFMQAATTRPGLRAKTEHLTSVYALLRTCPELNRFALVVNE